MRRFVVIYNGQAFPVRSKSAEKVRTDILAAYARQDGSEHVKLKNITMASMDIANGRYVILDLDEWFDGKKKGSIAAPILSDDR